MSDVPTGYKQTEVGLIPEAWSVRSINSTCESVLDCDHSTPVWTESGVTVIRNQNIRNGKLDLNKPSFTDDKHYKRRTRRAVPKFKDIVITREAPMGLACMIPEKLKCCLGQRMVLLQLRDSEVESYYFLYAVLGNVVQNQISVGGGVGSTVSNLRIPTLKQISIPFPPLPEQRAIASALADVDALLDSLKELLTKKRQLKQATMQELLTGKTRLDRFEGKWEEKRLGDVADIQRGASPRPIDSPIWFDVRSKVGWVRITDVTQSKSARLTSTSEYLSEKGISSSRFLPSGSLIMSICATVGVPIITDIDTCIHDGFVGFTSLEIKKEYLYFVLKSLEKEFQTSGQTGSQSNLNTDIVKNRLIGVPSDPEQKAIAAILSEMDAELEALEERVTKTRDLKQGMMQELLTGRTRLL